MNEQTTYTPSPWRVLWYRIKRLCSRILRTKPRFDVEQALKDKYWRGFQDAMEHYLGRCPGHPNDPPMMNLHHGNYRCGVCWARDYFRSLDAGPVTDPHQHLQITLPTQRPNQVYLAARREGKGEHTAALEAIPRRLVRLREKPKEG